MERTLAIIKPDAVERQLIGKIVARIEDTGLTILALRMLRLTRRQAEGFYAVHRQRPFFKSLTEFMASGPIVVIAIEGPDAIQRWRSIMGSTDPDQAGPMTIRREYGISIERNAAHGSDARDTAAFELAYFFPSLDLQSQ